MQSLLIPTARWLIGAVALALILPASLCLAQVDAVTAARYDLKLGFTVGGKVAKVLVKPGQRVEADQVLIELENEEGKAVIAKYKLQAESDLEIQAAKAEWDQREVELKKASTLAEKQAVSVLELELAKVKATIARLSYELAQRQRDEVKQQLAQAEAQHAQYLLKAPQAGVVDMVIVSEGELVEQLKPALRLVVIDPLWVDAAVPMAQTLELKIDGPAWVRSTLPGYENKPVQGKIIHLAAVADAASDTRLVRVEVPNTTHFPAGSHVLVSFEAPTAAVSARPAQEAR